GAGEPLAVQRERRAAPMGGCRLRDPGRHRGRPDGRLTLPSGAPDQSRAARPRSDGLLWAVFIAIATATQLTFKWAGSSLEEQEFGPAFLGAALAKPSVWLAIAGYLAMFVLWIEILKRAPLSRAYL